MLKDDRSMLEEAPSNKELANQTASLYDENTMNQNDQNNPEQKVAEGSVKLAKTTRQVFDRLPDDENTKTALSCGNILKQARQGQGFSLETVHEATKIPMDALRAIEEGYKIRSLSTFYYNGFVKIYANFLGIDPAELLGLTPHKVIPHMSDTSSTIDFDLAGHLGRFLTRRRKKQIAVAVGILLGLFLVFKIASAVSDWMRRPKAEKKIVKIEKRTTAVAKPSVVEPAVAKKSEPVTKAAPKTVEPIIAAVPAPVSAKVQKNVILTIRASKTSWLRVTADNTVVFQSNLNEGAVETWQANDKIEISGSNLNLLEFELNGKLIGKLGRKDRKAKAVVITKDGLSTK